MRIIQQNTSIAAPKDGDRMKKQKLEEAAVQFESIFISQILKSALPEGEDGDSVLLGKSHAMEIYKGMLYDAMAEDISKAGGFGLKNRLLEQYKELYDSLSSKNGDSSIIDGSFSVSSDFGFRNDPFSGKNSFHYGVDLAAPEGTAVKTPVDGTIMSCSDEEGYGNCIRLKGKDGNTYIFGHLKSMDVKEGDSVAGGTPIGKVGSTGRSTGPHLHLEIRNEENRAINPKDVVSIEETKVTAQRRIR